MLSVNIIPIKVLNELSASINILPHQKITLANYMLVRSILTGCSEIEDGSVTAQLTWLDSG